MGRLNQCGVSSVKIYGINGDFITNFTTIKSEKFIITNKHCYFLYWHSKIYIRVHF